MRRYGVGGIVAVAGDSPLGLTGGTAAKTGIFFIDISSESAPVSGNVVGVIQHYTADGTATTITASPLDGDGPAAGSVVKETYTSEPTYAGESLLAPNFNQQSRFQWFAQFEGELWNQLAAGDGIGYQITSFSTGTPTVRCTFHWKE